MKHTSSLPSTPMGTILGLAPGEVEVYSCDYEKIDETVYPDRHAFRHYANGFYFGYKWQCVELARRWLYYNKGYVFEDVAMAYDIFKLRHVRRVSDNKVLPYRAFANGCKCRPELGSLLIWDEGGEFEHTGHVAVVTTVTDDFVYFVEQNVYNHIWPEGQNYSRKNAVKIQEDGGFWIECEFSDTRILGWMIQTENNVDAQPITQIDPNKLKVHRHQAQPQKLISQSWLDLSNSADADYVKLMQGQKMTQYQDELLTYYSITPEALREIKQASNTIHVLFMHATDYILQDESRLSRFNIPKVLWPRIKQSWENRRNDMIVGRVDFALSEQGIKAYEYNADSASCLFEGGYVQGLWAKNFQLEDSSDPGQDIFSHLVSAWKKTKVTGLLHILQDHDLEENYHALYMKSAIEAAGIRCKILHGFDELYWDESGNIVDQQGDLVDCVWKTWAWETALEQLRQHLEQYHVDDLSQFQQRSSDPKNRPQLADVLLHPAVMVHEPLWTVIPSNKAILPILWKLFPHHRYLLESHYQLTESLQKQGYVSKPIAGRCGLNVAIVDQKEQVVSQTDGQFDHQKLIYQQLCLLPNIGGKNVQINTFNIDGKYSGSGVRVDDSLIISQQSNLLALRIMNE
ncbi:MAG: bifunctional glutathionylspermidine amidase/glutathionylspermidine synthase [Gammaproteobacteria bacterium CG22_combo_CG10-13_8_21_14_all_40_8]|nr:MAG: bifunctional glutathionylspermidine amidase/glutathionylspermidine synthase [Gammaproteobacteria bacterium CG22_combo_CG10-13_8_21_14_all_40_8]